MPINYKVNFEHRGRPRKRGPRRLTGDLDRLLDTAFGRGGRRGGGHGRGQKGPEVLDTSTEAIRAAFGRRKSFFRFGGKHARRVYKPEGRRHK